jgi:gliding motility-associated protein GldM
MAAYKETPRQKMIAMMYLVLTAMLALNVSKEIVDAFVVVNESIVETNKGFNKKLSDLYSEFDFQHQIQPEKTDSLWRLAQEVRALSGEMRSYLKDIKDTIIVMTENKPMSELKLRVSKETGTDTSEIKEIPLGILKKLSDFDKVTHYFVPRPEEPRKKGKAMEIRKTFKQFEQNLMTFVKPKDRGLFTIGPNFDTTFYDADNMPEVWEKHTFYRTILAADVTILNKLIAEVQNAEYDVINYLYSSVTKEDFKFTTIEAKVLPKRTYVLSGERYQADILVAAYDTMQRPEVYYRKGVDRLDDIRNGIKLRHTSNIPRLEFDATAPGLHKYAGLIRMRSPSGSWEEHHFKGEYMVGSRAATVSATKMNVFYKGVDNPVSVSVPGVSLDNIRAYINVGKIKQEGPGKYVVQLPGNAGQRAEITINAIIDGKESLFEKHEFRVKAIPDPIPTVGGNFKNGDEIRKSTLAISQVIALMPDYFDFEYFFMVKSFEMSYTGRDGSWINESSNSNKFTPRMKELIATMKPYSRIQLENIVVKAPEGTRTLKPITLKLR